MYDANYYMEKLRRGEYVTIAYDDISSTVLRRGILGYVSVSVSHYEDLVVVARRPKREVLYMIDCAVAYDGKINTYKRRYLGWRKTM